MAVKIRLTRMGAKGHPRYRIVATDSRDQTETKINEEIAMKWLERGAIPTDTVRNLFSKAGILKKFADSKNKKDN